MNKYNACCGVFMAGSHAAARGAPGGRREPSRVSGHPGSGAGSENGDGAGRDPELSRCAPRRAPGAGAGPSPEFGLLPWEFDSAISWNMNLFIFKREQT